ncbi:MAG: Hpt domain-containing protein, partial [Azonexus sp.]|nr:Hpt domain-containing protein [Azonexus sp.]
IAGVFLETWQRDIERLREGVAQGDAGLTERTAHSFRGSLSSFLAEPAIRVAADLETRARNHRMTGISSEIDSLEREIQALVPHLKIVALRVSE